MGTLSPPAGFVERRSGNVVWWIKAEWEDRLIARFFSLSNPQSAIRNPQSATPNLGGRGPIQRIEINAHEAIIVRRYRRGGFVRHFIRDLYWDYPPRPFVELHCTEEARRRGVPTVEVLGAQVEWLIGGFYRGLLITQEAVGFHNLWEWLQTEKTADLRKKALTVVARVIAHMHNAGIAHADLNPTNILVSLEGTAPRALIIDFDRARLFPGPVPPKVQESNLRRFQRYFAKYDVLQEWLIQIEFEYFRQVYEAYEG